MLIQDGTLLRGQQLAVVRATLDFMQREDMANRVLWVAHDGTMHLAGTAVV